VAEHAGGVAQPVQVGVGGEQAASAMPGSAGSACCATANTSPARAMSAALPSARSLIRSSMVGAASAAWYQSRLCTSMS
jgi:hypothetical protein